MKAWIFRPLSIGLIPFLLLIAVACTSNTSTQHPALTAVPAEPTPSASLPPTIAQPTLTSLPPTVAPTIAVATSAPETWDLLILSDSTNWSVGSYYAKFIEQDLKVKVNFHNCWVPGLSLVEILTNLQNNTYSIPSLEENKDCYRPWPELVKEAEVMILFGNPSGAEPPDGAWDVPESFAPACFSGVFENINASTDRTAYAQKILQSCDPSTFSTYKNILLSILGEIARIRENKPLILRMTDYYIPVHSNFKAAGLDAPCTTCMGNFSSAIQQVAQACGVPKFSTMDALNGPDHMLDPREKGYIDTDGGHLSEAGGEFVAKMMAQSGYEPWQPGACQSVP